MKTRSGSVSPQTTAARANGVTHTFWVDKRRAAHTLSHGGGTVGQISLLTLVPHHDFAVILVTNLASGSQIIQKVTNIALNHYLGLDTPRLTPIKTPEKKLMDLVGHYRATLSSAEATMNHGKLYISQRSLGGFPIRDTPPDSSKSLPPFNYEFYSEDNLVGMEEPYKDGLAKVLRKPDGGVEWLRIGTRIYARAFGCAII